MESTVHHHPETGCFNKPTWTLRDLARVLPAMPGHLRRLIPTFLSDRPISAAFRERLMLAVAAENRCWYCQTAHRTFGEAAGLDPREMDLILAGDDSEHPPGEQLALRFVRDLAMRQFESRDEVLYQQLAQYFSDGQREAIESTAHIMNFANRFGNTFDAARHRALGSCDSSPGSTLDLALISFLFVPAGLMATPLVGALMLKNRLK